MKSLRDQIADIKSANTSKSAKKQALVKLGITPYEITLILGGDDINTPSRDWFTFGVEIECGVNRGAIRSASETTGMSYEYEGYNHRDGHNYFKFVHDGSLIIEDAVECVSPVLRGASGKKILKMACDTLNRAGASVNGTCGLHVHIGAHNLTDKHYANVFVNYYYLEKLIDTFMAVSRRDDNNQYCHTIQDHSRLQYCETISQVQIELERGLAYPDLARYHKINAQAYNRHKTIEFRQHQGTTNFEKIFNWVTFCGKLVIWSKNNRLDHAISRIDDIPFLGAKEKSFFKNRVTHLVR